MGVPGLAGAGIREVELTQDLVALVDEADYELVTRWKWYAVWLGRGWYAERTDSEGKHIKMEHIIMGSQGIDHINRNGLDNRRSNLRVATHQQNMMNKGKQHGTWSSKFKGVSFSKERCKWEAKIYKDGRTIHLGRYKNEVDAAKAYDEAAINLQGEFAVINFPREEFMCLFEEVG